MADSKISQLSTLTKATVATNDSLPIVDTSATATKQITYQELVQPQDDQFAIADNADNTKKVAFQVSGVTTGTTRTLTVPDANTTIVGTDATQTLTNKTLTSPQINMSSNATGDMYYRDGSGVFQRLVIGSASQILQVSSGGIPEWIANPSASAASATVSGIVELATTAETTTGTDATRAVTPQGLHDMTSLSGAAWFLDEDTMSSDSATKTASQQSIKAYVDTSLSNSANASETSTSWFTYQIPYGDSSIWTLSATNKTQAVAGAPLNQTGSINTDSTGYTTTLTSVKTGSAIAFGATTELKLRFNASAFPGSGTTNTGRWQFIGFAAGITENNGDITNTTEKRVGFTFYNGNYYAVSCSGSAVTSTSLGTYSATAFKNYAIVLTGTTSAKFYVNGSLLATISTNLPSSSGFLITTEGYVGNAVSDSGFTFISNMIISEKIV